MMRDFSRKSNISYCLTIYTGILELMSQNKLDFFICYQYILIYTDSKTEIVVSFVHPKNFQIHFGSQGHDPKHAAKATMELLKS